VLQQYIDEKEEGLRGGYGLDEEEAPNLITNLWKESSLEAAVSTDGLRLTVFASIVTEEGRRNVIIQLDLDNFFQSDRGRFSWSWHALLQADREKASQSTHVMIKDPNMKKLLFGTKSSNHSSFYHWYESAPSSLHDVNDLQRSLRPDDRQKTRLFQQDKAINGFCFTQSTGLFKFDPFYLELSLSLSVSHILHSPTPLFEKGEQRKRKHRQQQQHQQQR